MTILELMELIQTKEKALAVFQRIRWQDGLLCKSCGTYNSAHKHGKTKLGYQKYKCACGHVFSDVSDTFLKRKRIEIRDVLITLYELAQKKGITSVELGQKLGFPQKKAWNLLHVIRGYCKSLIIGYYKLMMRGVVETDEAYFGKGDNAQMVHGIVQRNKHAVIIPINDRTEATLKGNIENHVKKPAYIMSDTASAYGGLSCYGYRHFTLNHSKEEFSRGNGIHSNTIEGLWGNQKKILYGIHHGVRKKNLFNYVAEFILKFNLRHHNSTFPAFLQLFFNPPLSC